MKMSPTDNRIRDCGIIEIFTALKTNTTLTKLNLCCKKKKNMFIKWNMLNEFEMTWKKAMKLDPREFIRWVKCWKSTPHWQNWMWEVREKMKRREKRKWWTNDSQWNRSGRNEGNEEHLGFSWWESFVVINFLKATPSNLEI